MAASHELRGKVLPPASPPVLVQRKRLLTTLAEATQRSLTLISAGPGWGKTVMLSSWVGTQDGPVAWVSLDEPDSEPGRLWPLIGKALRAAGLVSEMDGFSKLPHDHYDTSNFLLGLFEILPGPRQRILIIDNAHLLNDQTALAEIDALIRYRFPSLRLILSGRSDPRLPLHQYRLSGSMSELRSRDLAMTDTEARALLSAHNVRLSRPELALLNQRSEGWAAGLRLAAMSMAASAGPRSPVGQLAMDEGSVGEYLIHEVLDRQPEEGRRLLIQSSFLDEVTGELAVAVTGIPHSGTLLAELARTNSFVIPVDRGWGTYRYHRLFGEVLRYLLKRDYAAECTLLQRRAAAWYQEHGDPAAAIRFAIKADDWSRVSAVLVHGGFARTFVERQNVAALGLNRLDVMNPEPVAGAQAQTESQIARAVVAVELGQIPVAEGHLRKARASVLPPDAAATAALIDIVAARHTGLVSGLDRASSLLLDQAHSADAVRSTLGLSAAVQVDQARAHFWAGYPHQEVVGLLTAGLSGARDAAIPQLELECLGLLQLAYAAAGRLSHSKEYGKKCQALLRKIPQLRQTAVQHLAAALTALVHGDMQTAQRSARRADELKDTDSDTFLRSAVLMLRAWILLLEGRLADSHQLLRSAPELTAPLPTWLAHVRRLTLAEVDVRLGRPQAALKVIADSHFDSTDAFVAVTAARALVTLGDGKSALRTLHPVLAASHHAPPLLLFVHALLISARAAQLSGDEVRAVADVMRAISLAGNLIIQPFDDARPMLQDLLNRHPEAAGAWPQGSSHSADFVSSGRQGGTPLVLVPVLTERETAVLRRLATSMKTDDIANELCVSINTVKSHIAAIYRKLPAAGRREAIARARQLELL